MLSILWKLKLQAKGKKTSKIQRTFFISLK